MTKLRIKKIVWDEVNLEHIKKHQVSKDEVEIVKAIIYHKRSYGGKYVAVGRSGTRLITIVLRRQGLGEYYLVTARDASKKERKVVYEIEKKK